METLTAAEAFIEPKPEPTKPVLVTRLLARKSGATLAELSSATLWQPHSVRAYISGLRKKGLNISLEPRRDGAKVYRLTKSAADAADA